MAFIRPTQTSGFTRPTAGGFIRPTQEPEKEYLEQPTEQPKESFLDKIRLGITSLRGTGAAKEVSKNLYNYSAYSDTPQIVRAVTETDKEYQIVQPDGQKQWVQKDRFLPYKLSNRDEWLGLTTGQYKTKEAEYEKQSPTIKFLDRMGAATREVAFGETQLPMYQTGTTGNQAADIAASAAGGILGLFAPTGGGAPTLGGASIQAGKAAEKTAESIIPKALTKTGTELAGEKLLKMFARGAGEAVPIAVQQGLVRGETPLETGKRYLTEDVPGGLVFELGAEGLGQAASAVGKRFNRPSKNTFKIKLDEAKPETIIDSVNIKDAQGKSIVDVVDSEIEEVYGNLTRQLKDVNYVPDTSIQDIAKNIKEGKATNYYGVNIDRVFKRTFKENYPVMKAKYLDNFDAAKKANIDMQEMYTDDLYDTIVKKFGIQKYSKADAAIQDFGEKKLSLEELKKQFPDKWESIVEADKWVRKTYDEFIDKVNASRRTIYGDVPAQIKKLDDDIIKLRKEVVENRGKRIELEQGRPYETGKEIDLQRVIKTYEGRIENYKKQLTKKVTPKTKETLNLKIKNTEKLIAGKQDQLKQAKLYGQPSPKKFEKADERIVRLEKMLEQKEELKKSEKLWRNKMVPKRQDYYRHINETSNAVGQLRNLFETPSQIDPALAGMSEFTAPKSKFAGFMQRRGLGKYRSTAIGGMLDYIKAASYAINIDPQISKFRGLAKDLADNTAGTRNANGLIEYLHDFANNLSGKTGSFFFDRVVTKLPGGRTTLRVLNWFSNRIKGNLMLMNASTSLKQVLNVPNAIAKIKNPAHLSKGMGDMMASVLGKGKAPELYKQSQFLTERYSGKLFSRFDTGLLEQPKKFAVWMLNVVDEISTKFMWSSSYAKAIAEGIENPIKYADNTTRNLVGGRGIGEMPLRYTSTTWNLIAPFQLEVGNALSVMKDFVDEKDYSALAILFVVNYLFSEGMEKMGVTSGTFNPIGALIDALSEEDKSVGSVAGRLGGEVLGNVPGANIGLTLALSEDQRRAMFGKEDPTRFGVGVTGQLAGDVISGISEAVSGEGTEGLKSAGESAFYKLALPFGGGQLKKTIEGARSMQLIGDQPIPGSVSEKGKVRFTADKTPSNILKSLIFGQYATPEAQEYFKTESKQLGDVQSENLTKAVRQGVPSAKAYEQVMRWRELTPKPPNKGITKQQKVDNLNSNAKLTSTQKQTMKKLFLD